MKIGILGAGNVGGTLGRAWAKKGHEVFFSVRHPQDEKTRQLVRSTNARASNQTAKPLILKLAADVGFDPVDAGKLANARLLEPFAMLWIYLAFNGAVGRDFGFALLRRGSLPSQAPSSGGRMAAKRW